MKKILSIAVLLIFMVSCKTEIKENEAAKLDTIISEYQDHKGYDEKAFPLGVFTESYFQKEADFAQSKLDILRHIDSTRLSESGQISLALLKFQLQEAVDYNRFKMYLNPILSDAGFHASLPYMVRPLTNYRQVKEYLNKLNAIPRYVDENLVLIREGLKNGVSQPQVIFKGYESTYDTHIVDDYRDSFFYSPFKILPNSLSAQQRDSVLAAAKEAVENNVTPQFKRIKTFFETEYLPETRMSIGVSETPDGRAYYQNRIDYYTTSKAYTAEDIHRIGLNEVARIKAEMQSVIDSVGFKGSFADFLQFLRTDKQFYAKTPRELLMIARDIAKRIDAQLPRFFITLPRKPYGVAPVPASIAPKYTGGRYIESARSTDPGYFWVNTYDLPSRPLYTLPPLAAHEAVPGHHLQISLNNELGDSIPQFRRNLYLSAYGEGWGLYSEYLADEMGIYTTPYEKFGQLTYEMWRACRLVVDTGIHAKGWTRQQAVDYMAGNTALSMHEVNTEIDRYISWPGQALSYKMGELKIRELRKKAEDELGAKFDIRDFHEVILGQGTVTLPLLEKLVNTYIDTVKNG